MEYKDQKLWKVIESNFDKELASKNNDLNSKAIVVSSICFALKDNHDGISKEFWNTLINDISDCKDTLDEEHQQLVDIAI